MALFHPFLWLSSIPCIGEGNGNPLQCSCLENPRDRGAWWAAIYGVAQSGTQLKRLSSSSSSSIPCIYVPLLYPVLCWWTLRLLPCLGYCSEHWGVCISSNYVSFLWIYAQEWDCWIIWQFSGHKFGQTLGMVKDMACCSPWGHKELDTSIFKSRDITLPTKVRLIKAMVFPVVIYGCES